jgi:ElaB/YqjD/DUF883 family membrane-anchored ribosome-binding protein
MQTSTHKHAKKNGTALRSLHSMKRSANGVRGSSTLYRDLEKIKAALAKTTGTVKAKAQTTLIDSIDDLQDKYASMQKTTSSYVTTNPFKTIGYSVLAGLVLSFFIRR